MSKKKNNVEDFIQNLPEFNDTLKELDADQRVALLRSENTKLRNKLNKIDSGWEIIKNAYEHAYDDPIKINLVPPPTDRRTKHIEEAVLHLTDIHLGKETSTYNITIAAERLIKVVEAVGDITQLRRSFARIDKLHILLGGDMIEGDGVIFPGQEHEIDQDLIDQCIKIGPNYMANLIISLLQVFKELDISGVPGNHGRARRGAAKRNNYDSIFYEIVRLIVNSKISPKDQKRITWDLPFDRVPGTEWYAQNKLLGKWGYLLVHGDQVRGTLGFPWYGVGKKVSGWASHMPQSWDYLFMGHFHTHAAFELQDREALSTASTESDNAYALENMAAAGKPKQRICFFNERWGLLNDHRIHLEEREPRK